MNNSRIAAAFAAASVLLALCGCADSSGSSTAGSSSQTAQQTTSQTAYTTEDGLFTLDLNSRFSRFSGVYPSEFEFMFVDEEKGTTVGILEMSAAHISPKYFCGEVIDHYRELYGSVTETEMTEGGRPAYLLEAEFTDEESEEKNELRFYHEAIGYGNGDLLVLVTTVPKDTPEEAPKTVSDIMAGITYLGEAEKTDTEVHDTEYFTVSADKDWFFHSKSDTEAALRPNIAETTPEHYGSLKITADTSGSTAQELSAADAEEFGTKDKITNVAVSESEILGRKAVCVSCVLESDYMNLKRKIYYFDELGTVYKVQILAPDEGFEDFTAELGEVYDTIVIK
ncbi:MAG: hypothetical protein J6U16_06355 [Ruminococcus sp.]|nr:hypothetical protein [Ruminococcus sp.]